ncbi:hypothetical protein, partial [Thermomonas sp.]|uniref:hypothetical protein n=1 Tax=Thermomonas sp. TaxID=1971895 RepID=UPI0039E2741B
LLALANGFRIAEGELHHDRLTGAGSIVAGLIGVVQTFHRGVTGQTLAHSLPDHQRPSTDLMDE